MRAIGPAVTRPHMLQRKNLARILKGKQAGKRALGFGRNKVRCHRAAKLALSITLALDHVDSAIVDSGIAAT